MSGGAQRSFEFIATRDAVARALSRVEASCLEAGFPETDTLRVLLVIEELATNTVFHGYAPAAADAPGFAQEPGRFWIDLTASPREVVATYSDAAPEFNPTRTPAPLAERPDQIGGLGLHLVVEATDSLRYSYADGRNRLVLRFQAR